MASRNKSEALIVHEAENKDVDLNISVSHKHTQADTAQGNAGLGGDNAYPRQSNDSEAHAARAGQHWSTLGFQDPGPFTPSNGLHAVGSDHVSVFARSISFSGGVRQGSSWTSDPAPGAARAFGGSGGGGGNGAPLSHLTNNKVEVQTQGSGRTFRSQQSSRVGRKV